MRSSVTALVLVAGLLVASCSSTAAPTPQVIYVTPVPSVSPSPAATPLAPTPQLTPRPTPAPTPDTRAADLERARGDVTKILKYADWIGVSTGGALFYSLSESSLEKMYALAEKDRAWARKAQLQPDERDAIAEAIATVDALKMIMDMAKNDDQRGFMLALTIGIDIPIWRSDLIALRG